MVALAKRPNSTVGSPRSNLMNKGRSERPFGLGLIVGKFSPLHRGHEWLINQAAAQCDRLLILSYANPEFDRCAAPARRLWLAKQFPQHETLVIDAAWLEQACDQRRITARPIPTNDSSDETQQNFLVWLLKDLLKRVPDAMFCSEAYGQSCAAVLRRDLRHNVTAVITDLDRSHVPVSATQIRSNPHEQRQWMAGEVASAFVHRIALLGGESSGKTTLTAALADHFKTIWVHEYGRELWEQQKGILSEEDLMKIGHEQIRREEQALKLANGYLFCDTSPLTTLGYSLWMFGHVGPALANLATRTYDAIILCKPDFPFVQDGTRREEAFRDQQHAWYQERLGTLRCPVLEVSGTVSERVSRAALWLTSLNLR
jgi:HTH-type transcriptional repressor of NAD biosynthesis genes